MDAQMWNQLLMPLIVAVVPLIIAVLKRWIPPSFYWTLPLLATGLGPLVDFLSLKATGTGHGIIAGAAYGLMGVGLRELVDQLKKLAKNGLTGWLLPVLLLPALLGGCAETLRELRKDPAIVGANGFYVTIGIEPMDMLGVPIPLPTIKLGYGSVWRIGVRKDDCVYITTAGGAAATASTQPPASEALGQARLTVIASGLQGQPLGASGQSPCIPIQVVEPKAPGVK